MKIKEIVIICLSVLLFAGCFLVLCIQNIQLKKSSEDMKKIILEYSEHSEAQIESLKNEMKMLSDNQIRNKDELMASLSEIKNKSDLQYSKTVGMKNTYDELLKEQKKKTVDTAESDTEYQRMKNEAVALYQKGKYALSFDLFEKLVENNREDMESLMYKVKSLYFMNPADSARYSEIIEIMRTLKINSAADKECVEIEKAVLLETEGLSE